MLTVRRSPQRILTPSGLHGNALTRALERPARGLENWRNATPEQVLLCILAWVAIIVVVAMVLAFCMAATALAYLAALVRR